MDWPQGGAQVGLLVCCEAVTCLPGVTRQLPERDWQLFPEACHARLPCRPQPQPQQHLPPWSQ